MVGQRPSVGQEAGFCLTLGLQSTQQGYPESAPPAALAWGLLQVEPEDPAGRTEPALCPLTAGFAVGILLHQEDLMSAVKGTFLTKWA